MKTKLNLIVIDGCIGCGKTTLAKSIASFIDAETVLEDFHQVKSLLDFYEDPATHAFRTELEFTKYHYSLLTSLQTTAYRRFVCDFSLTRDLAYSEITLKDQPENLSKYKKCWEKLHDLSTQSSVVILLEASVDALIERIRARGREFEKGITKEYLQALTLRIRTAYGNCDNVIQIDTTDFTWLNYNIDHVAMQVLQMADK